MTNDFVHLHVHSEYSLLDGLGRVKNLVAEAKRLGQPALALTDHGFMHGAIEFFRACRKAEIKPIIGIEAYQTLWERPMGGRDPQQDRENYHLLLLAKNMTGYRNLLKIASRASTDGYYYKPRIDHDFLANHAEGIVCSTGCLGAEVPQLIMQGKETEAYERLGWYRDVFGKENFFIELQEHSIPELIDVNKVLVPWANKFELPLVVTNDVHYVGEEDGSPHDVLLCVQTGARVHDEKRMRLSDRSYFLKSRTQMEETFRPLVDLPASAFDHTLRIADMCDVDLEDKDFHLPDLPIPEGFNYATYLRHLTEEGLKRLYGARADDADVQERKERELRIINEMGFDVYFLIVADLCDFARSRNIWWNVRGSGAGSLVAYCIGITGLDPLKNNLIFERFLNPGRVNMPDFDLDYPDDQREEMIRYTVEKYGSDQVAQIVTFGRMKARAAIRDVGRAKDVALHEVDQIAKMIPAIPGKPATIQDVLTEGHEFYNPELVERYKSSASVRDLVDTAMQLEGVARHSGIHAAAVIVADRELDHYAPLMRGTKSSVTETIAQFEFPILESIGLLKVDFLGLSTLSVVREAGRLIKERHGIDYNLSNIPFEGEAAKEAFTLLTSGEVSGVFQVESQGMRRVLTEMRPSAFEHIIATISLYRPGPMEYIPNFIRRMHGEEEVSYHHPKLEPILGETYGICVYQEQIIQILSQLAGYTPGDADLVRRAIGKKKAAEIERHKQIFISGCEENGIAKSTAADIYADIEFFARYGFNKSHAADYAVICVQTAYLKAHFPVEYMAALLLVERDKTDKVTNFIIECRRMGIDVLPPDINYSGPDFEIQELPADTESQANRDPYIGYPFPVPEGSAIRFGMAAIKNVGEGPVQAIIEAREEGGPFTSLDDLCDRVDLRRVSKRALEFLIKAGALDRFGARSRLLAVMDQMTAHSAGIHSARESGQLSMFDLMDTAAQPVAAAIRLPDIEEASGKQRLQWEKELLGVYTMSHPLQHLSVDLGSIVTCASNELDERYNGKPVTVAGMIADVRVINTKKGDQMAFVQLEDLQGQCEVVVFPRTYAEYKEKLVPDTIVMVKGKAQTREGSTSVLADSLQNYVEQAKAVAGADVEHYEAPLVNVAPTINGVATSDDEALFLPADESDSEADDDRMNDNQMDDSAADAQEAKPPQAQPAERRAAPPARPDSAAADMNLSLPPEEVMPTDEVNPFRNEAPAWSAPQAPDQSNGSSPAPKTAREKKADYQAKARNENAPAKQASSPAPAPKKPDSQAEKPANLPRVTTPSHNRKSNGGEEKNGSANGNGKASDGAGMGRLLTITFRRSGDIDRDIFRLKEIYERVRDPRGRDQFAIRLDSQGRTVTLTFPYDPCSVNERLTGELTRHFRVEVNIEE
ncbi:MAG: DNA polymerase III subunit alpha [Caldilineaceae bacterium]|nr:DNA polymerase III subunit alpha [Caldilineaceae bacterium]